jgi:hypothetical protein
MIDSLSNLLFGCRHRRTSFPQRPVSRRGAPPEDMYVVCLDCAKRFHYDWEQMRIGAPEGTPVLKKSKLRYVLAACALPVIWLIGKAAMSKKRYKPEKEQDSEPKYGKHDE